MMTKNIRQFFPNMEDKQDSRIRSRYGISAGIIGICCNALLFLLKLIVGLIAGSISIVADAFNNLSDGLSCFISVVGFRVSNKEPDARHPFGYGRTEYIAGLVVSFLIMLVGVEFCKTSFDRILHPAAVLFSPISLGILAVSIFAKLWLGWLNKKIGTLIQSPVLLAAGQDSRNDVITTAVVALGMIAGRYTTLPLDGYVGVGVALFILWSGIGIARDTIAPLLGEAADPELVQQIEKVVLQHDGIIGVHDMIIHNYGAGRSLASVHAEVPSNADLVAVHEIIDEAEKEVWRETGVFLVIHIDPVDTNNRQVTVLREKLDAILREIDPKLSMHDFRVVPGEKKINLIFDVVAPFTYHHSEKQKLLSTIQKRIQEIDPRYCAVVTIDHQM